MRTATLRLVDLLKLWRLLALLTLLSPVTVHAQSPQQSVQTTWRLLDYVAVDYAGAVAAGRVVSESEFAEMTEFAATAERQLATLPRSASQPSLLSQARALREAIAAKAPSPDVAARARRLGHDLLLAYPVPMAPTSSPDLGRGLALYRENCAACHGATGHGDGPSAATLNPRPVNFTDRTRARERSIFALEQVIEQGLEGTAMPSFAHLPSQDRWALAFAVSSFAFPEGQAARGRAVWEGDPDARRRIPDLAALAALTPQALANQVGEEKAAGLMAYLRRTPAAVEQRGDTPLALTRSRLAESLAAYRIGNAAEARRLALSAYLDGFEPVEPILSARDAGLVRRIETAMAALRSAIADGKAVVEVENQARQLDALFAEAEQVLATHGSGFVSTFVSALTILLREGIEALLIVIAMIAFLKKADRKDVLPFVHAGWISALLLGAATWLLATTLISFSGASREITEGVGGVIAALVLVFVGIWMHGKAQADAWQRYVREKLNKALSRSSGWVLFSLAFIAVYREVFETILFYAAMWNDSPSALLAGVIVGALTLAGLAWAMLRFTRRLPISQFFRFSSFLMAALAVILAGKGVAAIQEAGLVGVTPVSGLPTIEALGVHPSAQVAAAQLAVLVAILFGFWLNSRKRAAPMLT